MHICVSEICFCRGIDFGIIYGGIIYPPNNASYYPTAIVNVVVFGPVFAQSWFFGPTRVICWSVTMFYRPGGERIYNPRKPQTLPHQELQEPSACAAIKHGLIQKPLRVTLVTTQWLYDAQHPDHGNLKSTFDSAPDKVVGRGVAAHPFMIVASAYT